METAHSVGYTAMSTQVCRSGVREFVGNELSLYALRRDNLGLRLSVSLISCLMRYETMYFRRNFLFPYGRFLRKVEFYMLDQNSPRAADSGLQRLPLM